MTLAMEDDKDEKMQRVYHANYFNYDGNLCCHANWLMIMVIIIVIIMVFIEIVMVIIVITVGKGNGKN